MSIFKALALTLLLVLIYSLIQIGLLYSIQLFENNAEFFAVWNAAAHIISVLIAYFIIFKFFRIEKIMLNDISDFRRINDNVLFYIVLIVIGLHLFNKPLWRIEELWEYINYSKLNRATNNPDKLNLFFVIRSLSTLIIAPVVEELFFRKYLITKLIEKYSLQISITVSSLLFSLIHIESPSNLIPTFIFGIISGILFTKTKRIAYPILFHFLYNLIIQLFRISNFPLDAYLDSLNYNITTVR